MHRWKFSALAAAAFVSAAMTTTDAAALALGSLTVQSALGENLRAEIAIPQITASEMDSLLSSVASPEVFRAQGMSYSTAARSIQVQLQRNADGTASLRLSSTAPINEPFLDLVLESNWSSGHLVRSYTLLLDPPATQRRATAPIAAPQVTMPASAATTGRSYTSGESNVTRIRPAASAPVQPAPEAADPSDEVRVRAGDTAGKIAHQHRRAGASLDQMLVAMLRSNPNAFINGNVNRLRAGTVIQLPSQEQALATPEGEARRIVAAQSRDFNTYRRSLASKAPTAQVQAADRSSGGQVQAHVEDASPVATQADKLTLSKGDVKSTAANEEKLANEKQSQEQSDRLSELQRNLAELNELAQKPAAAPVAAAVDTPASTVETAPATATADAAAPAIEVPVQTALPTAETTAEPTAATATPAAPEASAEPPAPPAPKPKPKPKAPPPPPPEPTLTEQLMENPLVPAGAGVVALLLGLLGYRSWKRRRDAAAQDPALNDSQLPPDSFFGGSGGQQVDTNSAEGATTMAYSPSQLDANGDIDPVAEADVYLALGRDVQAEEILKEALHTQPERISIHMKLAEIYAKRQDVKGLESTARKMQELSSGEGSDWKRVVIMGRNIDPTNPFYASVGDVGADTILPKSSSSFADALQHAKPASKVVPEVDLNLDLDLPDGLNNKIQPLPTTAAAKPSDADFAALDLDTKIDLSTPHTPMDPPTLVADTVMPDFDLPAAPLAMPDANTLDLDLSAFEVSPAPSKAQPPQPAAVPAQDLGMDLGAGLDFNLDSVLPPAAAPAPINKPAPAASPADNALDFDLGSLDLNLDVDSTSTPAAQAEAVHNANDDPLSTKLDLAQEFNTIGDSDGARALIEEVLAEANGPMKARAQKMLSELD